MSDTSPSAPSMLFYIFFLYFIKGNDWLHLLSASVQLSFEIQILQKTAKYATKGTVSLSLSEVTFFGFKKMPSLYEQNFFTAFYYLPLQLFVSYSQNPEVAMVCSKNNFRTSNWIPQKRQASTGKNAITVKNVTVVCIKMPVFARVR